MYKTFTSFVENNQSIDEKFIMNYIKSELNNRNLEKYNNGVYFNDNTDILACYNYEKEFLIFNLKRIKNIIVSTLPNKQINNNNEALNCNISILHVINHELSHIMQKAINPNNSLNDLLPQKKNQSRIIISEEIGDSATDSMPNTISQTNDNFKSSKSTKFSIDKIKNNHIQGLEDYTKPQIKNITTNYIKNALGYANVQADIVGMEIIGSRNRGTARLDSDLDIVVELKGDNLREDDLFNLLNDNDETLEINGIKVDINPIIVEKSGTLKEFMKRSNEYDKEHTRYSTSEEKNDLENNVIDNLK